MVGLVYIAKELWTNGNGWTEDWTDDGLKVRAKNMMDRTGHNTQGQGQTVNININITLLRSLWPHITS